MLFLHMKIWLQRCPDCFVDLFLVSCRNTLYKPLIICKIYCRKKNSNEFCMESGDDDVDMERQRVLNGEANSDCLRLVNLTKVRIFILSIVNYFSFFNLTT